MKKVRDRIKDDLKKCWKPVLLVAGFLALVQVLGGGFCPLRRLTGLPCPACGMSRALVLMFTGAFGEAWKMHPFVYAAVGYALLWLALRYFRGSYPPWLKVLGWLLVAGCVCYYAWRMKYWFPNQSPMVYYEDSVLGRALDFGSK